MERLPERGLEAGKDQASRIYALGKAKSTVVTATYKKE